MCHGTSLVVIQEWKSVVAEVRSGTQGLVVYIVCDTIGNVSTCRPVLGQEFKVRFFHSKLISR